MSAPLRGQARALRRLRFAAALFAVALAACAAPARAQAALEASVKAAYLFKFLAYVEWPSVPADNSPLVVGVMGADAVLAELKEAVVGRRVNNRPVDIRRVSSNDRLEGLHALYVGREAALAPAARALRGEPVLLVTDSPDGLAAGGVLNFVVLDGRVRFEASLPAADRNGLKLSSRLLGVAERVLPP